MKRLFLVLFVVCLLIGLSCKDKGTEPQPSYPPGYQHDIPWPSLADSPWPMNHGDPQNTGRSKFVGPELGIIDWTYQIEKNNGIFYSSASINYNGIALVGTSRKDSALSGFNKDGKIVWQFTPDNFTNYIGTTPIIAKDSTIYICDYVKSSFYAITNDGKIKWSLSNIKSPTTGMNIGLDGTIYTTAENGVLYAIDKSGDIKWTFTGDFLWGEFVSLVFSPDGRILYIPGKNSTLYAFDIQNISIKWSFGKGTVDAAPLVDYNGNIYSLTETDSLGIGLYCLSLDGKIKWFFLDEEMTGLAPKNYQDPTIDKNGNIYFGYYAVYSINHEGKLNWKKKFGGAIYSPFVCDNLDNIYISVLDELNIKTNKVVSLSKSGNINWEISVSNYNFRGGFSPVITNDNRLIFVPYKSQYIFSIK